MPEPMACFLDMLHELQAVRRLLYSGDIHGEPAQQCQAVHDRLAAALGQVCLRESETDSEDEREVHRLMAYAATAVLDEALAINLDWPGRPLWPAYLLEQRLWHSRAAGQRFYEGTQRCLQADARHAAWRALAGVQLLALQQGFKGQLRGAPGEQAIADLRQRLYAMAQQEPLVAADNGALCPQAQQHNLVQLPAVRRSAGRPRLGLAVLLVLWLVASTLLWHALVSPLQTPAAVTVVTS